MRIEGIEQRPPISLSKNVKDKDLPPIAAFQRSQRRQRSSDQPEKPELPRIKISPAAHYPIIRKNGVKIKFLADVNVEKAVVEYLLEKKYDTKWIPEYNCEMSDEDLLHLANIENRIIITNDKDFGELIYLQKKVSTGIILFRVREQRAEDKVNLIKYLLENFIEKIMNHFIVITEEKVRIIPMEVAK